MKTASRCSAVFRRFEVKAVDDAARTFEGMAAAFTLDLGGDVILPGAFKRTLRDWNKGKGRIVPLIDTHGRDSIRRVVGKMIDAEETTEGLWAKHDIIEGPDGDEVYRRVKGGYVDGLSIGYEPVKIEMPTPEQERTGVWRFLKELKLRENSVCVWPMNEDARVDLASVKSLEPADVRRLLVETYSSEEIAQLKASDPTIRALFASAPAGEDVPPAAPPAGLAPEDPRRLALEHRLRGLTLRGLGIRLA